MTTRVAWTWPVLAGGLAAAVPYVAGVTLLTRHAVAGEPDLYASWRDCVLGTVTFAVVGALIQLRRPDNRVGPVMAALGVLPAVQLLSGESGASKSAEILEVAFSLGFLLLLQIFPEGRLPGPRWRWVTGCTAVALVGLTSTLFVGLPPAAWAALLPVYAVAIVGSAAAPVVRWRRGDARLRAQMKWVAFAAVAALVIGPWQLLGAWSGAIAASLLPVAVVVAILRYRLYDIDLLISRTLSYAVLTTLLVAVYLVLVAAASRLVPDGSSLAVAGSTLAAAALFQPLRRRVQSLVDRRFNRARYDAEHTVASFAQELRQEVDLDSVRDQLLTVVRDTLQPASANLWLRTRGGSR